MSLHLAKNETVVRKFDYATLGYKKKNDSYAVARSLIVTNRRVIHQNVNETFGKDLIVRKEMPIESAKFVDVQYSKTSNPGHLIRALVFAILGIAAYCLIFLKDVFSKVAFVQKLPDLLFIGIAGFFGLIALISLISYFANKQMFISCTVSTDTVINPVLSNTIADEISSRKKAKKKLRNAMQMDIELSINKQDAKELADGLGAAILDAIEMNRAADAAAPTASTIPAINIPPINVPPIQVPQINVPPINVTLEMPTACCATVTAEPAIEEITEDFTENTEIFENETQQISEEPVEETVEETVEDTLEETETTVTEEEISADAVNSVAEETPSESDAPLTEEALPAEDKNSSEEQN